MCLKCFGEQCGRSPDGYPIYRCWTCRHLFIGSRIFAEFADKECLKGKTPYSTRPEGLMFFGIREEMDKRYERTMVEDMFGYWRYATYA